MAIIVDSDVLIDSLRGSPQAITFLEVNRPQIILSAATVGELYQGIRKETDFERLDSLLSSMEIAPITFAVARLGGEFSRRYGPSHGCGMLDCFIAATARLHHLALYTFNLRHFPMLPDARRPYAK